MKTLEGNDDTRWLKKYTLEQYELAEMMLTHGFSILATARVCRMSNDAVQKLSDGEVRYVDYSGADYIER